MKSNTERVQLDSSLNHHLNHLLLPICIFVAYVSQNCGVAASLGILLSANFSGQLAHNYRTAGDWIWSRVDAYLSIARPIPLEQGSKRDRSQSRPVLSTSQDLLQTFLQGLHVIVDHSLLRLEPCFFRNTNQGKVSNDESTSALESGFSVATYVLISRKYKLYPLMLLTNDSALCLLMSFALFEVSIFWPLSQP